MSVVGQNQATTVLTVRLGEDDDRLTGDHVVDKELDFIGDHSSGLSGQISSHHTLITRFTDSGIFSSNDRQLIPDSRNTDWKPIRLQTNVASCFIS